MCSLPIMGENFKWSAEVIRFAIDINSGEKQTSCWVTQFFLFYAKNIYFSRIFVNARCVGQWNTNLLSEWADKE